MYTFRLFLIFFLSATVCAYSDDSPHWGIDQGRNRISRETDLPTIFKPGRKDPAGDGIVEAGPNVRWVARLGSRTYTPPIVANGKVLIGTNSENDYDPTLEGDHGVMLCLDEKTGKFLWQYARPKITDIKFFDAASIGITSTPTVVGNRVYFIDNRGTVCNLDIETGKPIWQFDLIKVLGVRQHDTNNCSILFSSGLLYLGTANGLDGEHKFLEVPKAPTLVVLDAESGRPLARDDGWVETAISHGQWCSPAIGTIRNPDGTEHEMIFYGTGHGDLHVFRPLNKAELLKSVPPIDSLGQFGEGLHRIKSGWTFDGNGPEAVDEVKPFEGGRGSSSFTTLPPPVFADNKLFLLFCFDGFTGKSPRQAFLTALDPTVQSGVQKSRLLWKTANIEKGAISPQAVSDGLIYFGDRTGGFYCLDAQTGKTVWKLDLKGDHWTGPLIADGKIYCGTDRRMFYILHEGREPKILNEIEVPEPIFAGATAANKTLFIPMNKFLYAVEKEKPAATSP